MCPYLLAHPFWLGEVRYLVGKLSYLLSGNAIRVNKEMGIKMDQIQLCFGSCFEEVAITDFDTGLCMALDKSFHTRYP